MIFRRVVGGVGLGRVARDFRWATTAFDDRRTPVRLPSGVDFAGFLIIRRSWVRAPEGPLLPFGVVGVGRGVGFMMRTP